MRLGVLSDTHDQLERTAIAVRRLVDEGVEAIVHCGDLTCPEIVETCAVVPFWFVFGNNDADAVPELRAAAAREGVVCLGWRGEITLDEKRIAVAHGHLTSDLRPLLVARPDYLMTGHSHEPHDFRDGTIRRINPGALHRANRFTVAILDLTTDELRLIEIPR